MAVDVIAVETAEPPPGEPPTASPRLVGVLAAVLAVPLVVGVVAVRRPTWSPVLDLAMTELRLRDVGTSHTPLIGLPGRIGTLAEQGSHPGPLSFYVLAPVYRLFGSTAWAMQLGTAVLNIGAMAASLWLASRRGGRALVLAVAPLLGVLALGYGIGPLLEPWNPYLPVLWWFVVLLAVWSVVAGDVAMLPVAVVAGSFCAQTHLPYLGLAGGLGAVALAALAWRWWRADGEHAERRRIVRWTVLGVGIGVLLWIPPVLDQAVHDPGNVSLLADHLGTPSEPTVGPRRGVELALLHLDVFSFVRDTGSGATGSLVDASSDPDGSIAPGLLALAAWAVAATWAAAHRRAHGALVQLHLVVGAALALGAVSMSRIFGKVWYYLMLWAWGTAAMVVLAIGWTIVAAVGPRLRNRQRATASRVAAGVAAGALVLTTVVFVADAIDVDPPSATESRILGRLVPDTVAALERGDGDAVGPDGTYVVEWTDAYYFGSQGYGLVSELERAGLDARAVAHRRVPVTDHRVLDDASAADATVYLVTGGYIDDARALPGVLEVAYFEPRDDAQRAEFDRLRSDVLDDLRATGLDDIVPIIDLNLFGASIDERVPDRTQRAMARMLDLGQPAAVFIAPPGTVL
jgi:hypothetical protein